MKIGPSLGKKIKIPCMSALLKTSDGFTALPFAVRVSGPMKNLTFSADTAAWNNAKGGVTSLTDTMKNLLRAVARLPQRKGQSELPLSLRALKHTTDMNGRVETVQDRLSD